MTRVALMIGLLMVVLAGCMPGTTRSDGHVVPGDVQQLPQAAKRYIEMSHDALAAHLHITPDRVTLESVMGPANADDAYVIKLVVADNTYTYQGHDGQISLISATS